MVEYTRELLNSNCDFGFVIGLVRRVTRDKLFETRVLERIQATSGPRRDTRVILDITHDKETKVYCDGPLKSNYRNERYDYELSWKIATEMIVKELRAVFVDSNVYSENKEIRDIYDTVTVHRLIVVDWS